MTPQTDAKRPYEKPSIKVLDEAEMLAQFQVTSAISGWWN
jgi:hypothetical protein